jgi:hypothetical protein
MEVGEIIRQKEQLRKANLRLLGKLRPAFKAETLAAIETETRHPIAIKNAQAKAGAGPS